MWSKLRRSLKKIIPAAAGIVLTAAAVVFAHTGDLPESFDRLTARADKIQFLDRSGIPLNTSYLNYWNVHDTLRLYETPPLLVKMFVAAEDRNFYSHSGVDWRARAAALFQNIKAGKIVRGASSLSEQVVRMIIPPGTPVFKKRHFGILLKPSAVCGQSARGKTGGFVLFFKNARSSELARNGGSGRFGARAQLV